MGSLVILVTVCTVSFNFSPDLQSCLFSWRLFFVCSIFKTSLYISSKEERETPGRYRKYLYLEVTRNHLSLFGKYHHFPSFPTPLENVRNKKKIRIKERLPETPYRTFKVTNPALWGNIAPVESIIERFFNFVVRTFLIFLSYNLCHLVRHWTLNIKHCLSCNIKFVYPAEIEMRKQLARKVRWVKKHGKLCSKYMCFIITLSSL